ncbi:MAG TPA: hypothetical protein ENN32_09120 [Chloroflexi bacterium]|nr:hypothetical protein [Chloroflexota bacterium]
MGLVIPVLIGGDHFVLFRFYQPIWAVLFLPCLSLIDVFHGELLKMPAILRKMFVVILMLAIYSIPRDGWLSLSSASKIRYELVLAEQGQQLGSDLNAIFPVDRPSVGVIAAGGVAFTYDGIVIDVMGLNNLEVAHTPGNRHGYKNHAAFSPDVFFRQQPDLLLHGWQDILKDLFCDERFSPAYQLAVITDNERSITAYIRREYLQKLSELGLEVRLLQPLSSCP